MAASPTTNDTSTPDDKDDDDDEAEDSRLANLLASANAAARRSAQTAQEAIARTTGKADATYTPSKWSALRHDSDRKSSLTNANNPNTVRYLRNNGKS